MLLKISIDTLIRFSISFQDESISLPAIRQKFLIIVSLYTYLYIIIIHNVQTTSLKKYKNFLFNWLTFSSKRKKREKREFKRSLRFFASMYQFLSSYRLPPSSPRPETRSRFIPTTPYTIHVCYQGRKRGQGRKGDPNHGQHAAINQPPFLPIFRPFLLLLSPRLEGGQPRAGRRAR